MPPDSLTHDQGSGTGPCWGTDLRYRLAVRASLAVDPSVPASLQVHCVSKKKLPTFKLSVTLSNVNRFSKFLHCWKAYEICYKTYMALPTSP